MREKAGGMLFDEINAPGFVRRLKAGGREGREAFEALVKAIHHRLLRHIMRHLRSPEEAQEVLQDALLACYRGIGGFQEKSKLTTWIYGLAYHKICDRIAERDRKHVELDESHEEAAGRDRDDSWSRVTPWDSTPERVMARGSAEYWMARAVEELTSPGKDVYHLRDVEGLSGQEVAEILGISHTAVRVHLHRVRGQIVDSVRKNMASGKGPGISGEGKIP